MQDAHSVSTIWERAHVFSALFWVLLAIVLCFILLRFLKQRVHFGHASIQILGASNIGVRERLAVVQAGGEYFLIGATPNTISLLHHFGSNCPPGFESNAKKKDFSGIMAAYTGSKKA